MSGAGVPTAASEAKGRVSLYRYSQLRGVPQSYLRHPLDTGILAPALDQQGRIDPTLADRLLVAATRPGSKLGRAVRKAVQAATTAEAAGEQGSQAAELAPAPEPRHPPRQRRRWQLKPLPDPDADLPAPVRQAQDHLRQRDFAVVRQQDGRFKVETELLTAAELVARAQAMREREDRLRTRRLGLVQAPAPTVVSAPPTVASSVDDRASPPSTVAVGEHGQHGKDHRPTETTLDALLAVARRSDALGAAELAATMAVLETQGLAHFERHLLAARTRVGLAAARARGRRLGRKPLDADKAATAIALVASGLSPSTAARQVGLGRSTVYREVSRAGIGRGA